MYPSVDEANRILDEAEKLNPGAWVNHSKTTAHCARKIAELTGMDPDKAYVLGLLHDIGRRFGVSYLRHVSDGYSYMMSLGYDDAARVCLSHSFFNRQVETYVGKFDTSEEEMEMLRTNLKEAKLDEYDDLIKFCDSIAGSEGVMEINDRMNDVASRYGHYDPGMRAENLALKDYYEKKMGMDLYEAVEKDTYKP